MFSVRADQCGSVQMSDVFEGSLIRAFRRLQELIRQMAMAAKAIGNTELEDKFLNCSSRNHQML